MKVLLVASFAPSVVRFRGQLIEGLVASGHRVEVACPGATTAIDLANLVQGVHDIRVRRTSLRPHDDIKTVLDIAAVVRRVRPDVVLAYTIKPVIYSLLLACLFRVPRKYALITGVGYAFAMGPERRARRVILTLYRLALRGATKIFFQNEDDQELFRSLQLLGPASVSVVVNGSGVDLAHFVPRPLPSRPVFLMMARFLRSKGLTEFLHAAADIKKDYPEVTFLLAGGEDDGPDAVPMTVVLDAVRKGVVEYCGVVDDVRTVIERASVCVLPSYREGTPRSILEAMAMGRAVITTDVPGCRSTVVDGSNGLLVAARSAQSIVAAAKALIEQPDLVVAMGKSSRAIAEQKFDVHAVNAVMLQQMGLNG